MVLNRLPEAPAESTALLLDGAAKLGLPLEPDQGKRLLSYLALLNRWNAVHNLSALRDSDLPLQRHLLDSMAIVGPLARQACGRPMRVLDAGTGAGLPAVVLAILQPRWAVTAVDAVAKKVAFVRQVVGELGIPNLLPRHGRLEGMSFEHPFDIVVSRAFSSLQQFVAMTRRHLASDGVWVAMKGRQPLAEIAGLGGDLQVFHVEPLQIPGLNVERCLVWIREAPKR